MTSSHRDALTLTGNIIDVVNNRIFPGKLTVEAGNITSLVATPECTYDHYLSPGLVDAHIHIESSMLAPTEFARVATQHGTIASVSDPHEIANVLGICGVEWMIANGESSPFKFFFGAPSCVPATPFETAGASLEPADVEYLLEKAAVKYLAEVMNFPAVINREPKIMQMIATAKKMGKKIDGHAPGLIGEALQQYFAAGIETDHECVTLEEAQQRLALGMRVAIREGSAAKNFAALWPIVAEHAQNVFLCSDDKHPDDLVVDHINALLRRLVANGIAPVTALQLATLNPVQHYRLPVGLLRVGDPADIVEWQDLKNFVAQRTWINGQLVATHEQALLPRINVHPINQFATSKKSPAEFQLKVKAGTTARVIGAIDGQLLTTEEHYRFARNHENFEADITNDILKIAVVNRYQDAPPTIGLVKNIGLKNGAMASSVAHDSHNIVAAGTSDAALCRAINAVIAHKGGLCTVVGEHCNTLPLPIAGLMSDQDAWTVAKAFTELTASLRADGCPLTSPFMTLSFLALLVIPKLKISDRHLFDVDTFCPVGIQLTQ